MSTIKVTNLQDTSGGNASTSEEIFQGRAKAWVNFDGTFGTSPFTEANGGIRDSFNVTSVTDQATGIYQVNFTTAMPNTNYVVVTTSGMNSSAYSVLHDSGGGTERAPTVNDFYVRHATAAGTTYDRKYVCVAVFGD